MNQSNLFISVNDYQRLFTLATNYSYPTYASCKRV